MELIPATKKTDVFCASSPEAAAMSDEEFWDHVYPQPDEDEIDLPDCWAIHCLRCGRWVEVDEETRTDRERDAFCDDCAEETAEIPDNDSWDEIKSIM